MKRNKPFMERLAGFFSNRFESLPAALLLLCLAACQVSGGGIEQDGETGPSSAGMRLTPYYTATATISITPLPESTATLSPEPSATPEPETHEVLEGQDMITIAMLYGISLEDLRAANPGVNPNLISIGTRLVIPSGEESVAEASPLEILAEATPAPISLGGVRCSPALDGSLWCFVLVQNPLQQTVSGVSLRVTLQGAAGERIERRGSALLNGLRTGYGMPLQVYFPAAGDEMLSPSMKASAELVSAIPVDDGSGCCLPLRIENNRFHVLEDGLSAEVSGEVVFDGDEGSSASEGWVLAVAYDGRGRICGLRRWELTESLQAGRPQPYLLRVYSVDEPIDHVEVMAEAHH